MEEERMKVKVHLKVISILGKKETTFEVEAETMEDIKELLRLVDGCSI